VRRESDRSAAIPVLVGNGGAESACGWCKDKWGLSWQITPRALLEATTDPDRAAAKRALSFGAAHARREKTSERS